jgi:hypothetical protein
LNLTPSTVDKKLYPYTYGDGLTPEMARKNRKKAGAYSVLISSVWYHNIGFAEPSQSYSSFSNQPQIEIVKSISRGGSDKSGPGPRAKADASKNFNSRSSRYVDGFTIQSMYGSSPKSNQLINNKPLSSRSNVKLNQNQKPGEPSLSMEELAKRLSPEYEDYQLEFNFPAVSERFDTKNYDPVRFKELAKDPKAKKVVFPKTAVDEARTAIHAEIEGIMENAERIEQPFIQFIDLDYKLSGPGPYSHADVKHPVGSQILKKQKSSLTLKQHAYKMGQSIAAQKKRFTRSELEKQLKMPGHQLRNQLEKLGLSVKTLLDQAPESPDNILHVVDLPYVSPLEKRIIKKYCLQGAADSGIFEGIQFLNDNDDYCLKEPDLEFLNDN